MLKYGIEDVKNEFDEAIRRLQEARLRLDKWSKEGIETRPNGPISELGVRLEIADDIAEMVRDILKLKEASVHYHMHREVRHEGNALRYAGPTVMILELVYNEEDLRLFRARKSLNERTL